MNMPGFTADASLRETSGHYRSSATPGVVIGAKTNQVLMQRWNTTPSGGACYGKVGPDIVSGTYDSMGRCCGPHGGFQVCVDCSVNKCWDRRSFVTSGDFQWGGFATF